eukprot:3037350-Alexandrium_andersonii.AAC.1
MHLGTDAVATFVKQYFSQKGAPLADLASPWTARLFLCVLHDLRGYGNTLGFGGGGGVACAA